MTLMDLPIVVMSRAEDVFLRVWDWLLYHFTDEGE